MLLVSDHTTTIKGVPISMLTREDDVNAHERDTERALAYIQRLTVRPSTGVYRG